MQADNKNPPIFDMSRAISEPLELLRLIAQGTAWATGTEFFQSLVRFLAQALDTSCAFVTEFSAGNTLVKPLAFWNDGKFVDAPDYTIAGTPCEAVLGGEIATFPHDVCDLFPMDREVLESLGAESYLAIPIKNAAGAVLGHLATIDRRPRDWSDADFGILQIFGARTAAELGRRRVERELEAAKARLELEVESRRASEEALRQSEQAYRDLYEDAPVAYWSVGTDRIVKRVNKRVSEFLGYAHEEIVGQPLGMFTAPTPYGEPVALEVFQRFLRGEATVDQEVEFRHKDGRSAWASVSVTPVFNERGEIEVTRSVVVDITERKRAERELEHRLALENLIATASSRFVSAPAEEVDAEINRCMMEMARFYAIERVCVYCFTDDEQIAVHTHAWIAPDVTPPPDRLACSDLEAVFKDVLGGRVIGARTLEDLPRGYGPLRERLEKVGVRSIAILPLDYSRVMGMLLLECTRHEQDWAEEDLRLLRLLAEIIASALTRRDAENALEAASRAKSEFLASMSHELRTPLNGILGYAQLLARDPTLDARHFESVHGVQHCGEHLLDLVNEVLDLARIEAGRLELHPEEMELCALVDETADIARLRATQVGLGFVYETGSVLPKAVCADPRRVKQILLNLLGNAVKFTPEGEVRFRVSGTCGHSERWRLRFEIEDTGVGIPPEEIPYLFEPFHRVAQQSGAVEGTGLGLAITMKLVQAMGGNVQVESTPWRGSLFVVELELPEVDARARAAAQPRAQITGYRGRRRVLLIADDKLDNRAVLRQLLEPLGFQVYEAASGREALLLAERQRPDLILLDLVMPELDGFEVTRRLRRDPALSATPILAVSASVFEETRQTSLHAGCDDFLAKPVQLATVLAKLERHLGLQWTYRDETESASGDVGDVEPEPPLEQLSRLYQLSRRGDIAELNACLAEIEQAGEHPRFIADLRVLARGFDMKGIRERLRQVAPQLR